MNLIVSPVYADHIKVFLLGGQSNMLGTGVTAELPIDLIELQNPQADVLFYYNVYDVEFFTTLRPGAGVTNEMFGPEITFGRTIADAFPSDNFALIKHSKNGTSLYRHWNPNPATGNIYNAFRVTVSNGLAAFTAAGHTYEIIGMLWTQGETDSLESRTTAQYEADLNGFIADIRARYGANLPFFISRLSLNQTALVDIYPVRIAQENVAAADPHTYLIDTDGMTVRYDDLHYNAAGQVSMGEAFGEAYINYSRSFTKWIEGFDVGSQTGLNDDPDGDNLSNGLEAWFGTDPGQFNAGLANVSSFGLTSTFTHPQNTSVPSNLTGDYLWSPDLISWYGSGEGPDGGRTVIFTADTNGSTTAVTATASGSVDKCFFRARVIQN